MQYTKIVVLAAAGALSVASAIAPADARHAKRGWTIGVLRTNTDYYGPHYGYPTYPSYWYGPTSGVYPVDPSLCYVPRGYPYYGWWHWSLEYVC
ncbi:MAG TPA: hypothetical protein VNO18_16195 [Xanthobacteraceae bacterium]|nr:hypothetical protein [Xanthobacteraceae bacterium]